VRARAREGNGEIERRTQIHTNVYGRGTESAPHMSESCHICPLVYQHVYVAVCCSLLQSVAVCCSLLQSVVVRCSVLQCHVISVH